MGDTTGSNRKAKMSHGGVANLLGVVVLVGCVLWLLLAVNDYRMIQEMGRQQVEAAQLTTVIEAMLAYKEAHKSWPPDGALVHVRGQARPAAGKPWLLGLQKEQVGFLPEGGAAATDSWPLYGPMASEYRVVQNCQASSPCQVGVAAFMAIDFEAAKRLRERLPQDCDLDFELIHQPDKTVFLLPGPR